MRATWLSRKCDDHHFKGQPSGRDQFGAIEDIILQRTSITSRVYDTRCGLWILLDRQLTTVELMDKKAKSTCDEARSSQRKYFEHVPL